LVIRYKDSSLDVRIARSHDEFVMGKHRAIYRNNINWQDSNNIPLDEVIEILGFDISKIDYY